MRELAHALYGCPSREATVRSEMARLRPLLGAALRSRPYRLADGVEVDLATVQRELDGGRLVAARRRYAGSPLPHSAAPGIVAARTRLDAALVQP